MSEKRYYSVDYDEQYYIFDSNVIRKGRVEEEAEYSYDVFANSMSSTEIIDKLNELTNENEQLKEIVIEQLESALTIPFIRKEYCNALLRILDEEDSLESAKEYIKNFLGGSE